MKRCPTCQRIYTDDTLSFCLEDGAVLRGDDGAEADRTLALSRAGDASEPPPTEVLDPARAPTLPAPTMPAHAQPSAASRQEEPTHRSDPQQLATPERKRRNTASVVALTVVATVLLLGLSAAGAWLLLRDKNGVEKGGGGDNRNVTPPGKFTPTPTPPPTPPPEDGSISGSMTYPSDGIPGVMVACAENVETQDMVCSEKRQNWETSVRYSLKLPPGRYYVYGKLLAGDESVGEMSDKKAYYTDYIRCGMGENCTSHRRIVLEVKANETLSGVTVGDWWAEL